MSSLAVAPARGGSIVAGEYPFTEADFRQIAALLHADAGISLPETKATLVYSRLAKRLRALGLGSFQDYCDLVQTDAGAGERQKMLASLTTNVTRFFREPHHFDHLREQVLPGLLDAARKGARVRIWSAGCSSGQEPYSAAMTLLALDPQAARHDIRILATDIDPNVIAQARAGIYPETLLSEVPAELRRRFVRGAGQPGRARVVPELRELIVFQELNLHGPWPMKGRFDVIFCRNVAIYFEEDLQVKLWARFAEALTAKGVLYIGHSERVAGPAARELKPEGITTYRRTGGTGR
jgi:chemotaxis protein methyltransferase CheR